MTESKVVRIPPSMQRMVVYDDRTLTGAVATLNAAIAGKGAGLPDTYGSSADELTRLMSGWRDQALASAH